MSQILASVDSRTKLVGENRLELLMFRLTGRQIFALNVFKIQEVTQLPRLVKLPGRHAVVRGVIYLRDKAISVIDLSAAIGRKPMTDIDQCNLIVTEYNQSVQGFLVGSVDRIVNLNWLTHRYSLLSGLSKSMILTVCPFLPLPRSCSTEMY